MKRRRISVFLFKKWKHCSKHFLINRGACSIIKIYLLHKVFMNIFFASSQISEFPCCFFIQYHHSTPQKYCSVKPVFFANSTTFLKRLPFIVFSCSSSAL